MNETSGATTPAGAPQPLTPEQLATATKITGLQVSPDGQQVAFVRQPASKDANKDNEHPVAAIWVLPFADGDARQFTSGLWHDVNPQWSPDSQRLAFFSDRAKRGEHSLYLMSVSGGEATRVWEKAGSMSGLSWSPDGRWLAALVTDPESEADKKRKEERDDAFVWDEKLLYQRLWLVDPATGETVCVSPDNLQVWSYAWAPDSERLAICTTTTPRIDDTFLATETAVISRSGGERRVLMTQVGVAEDLVWSPDGERLAWRGAGGRVVQGEYVYAMPTVGGERTCLTPEYHGTAEHLQAIGDGARLLMLAVEGVNCVPYILTWDGTRTPILAAEQCGCVDPVSISDDGSCLAAVFETGSHAADVWIAHLDTTGTPMLRRRTNFNAELEAAALGDTEVVRWTSDPGVEVQGLLIKPVGYRDGRRYPLVVVIHGGPTWAWVDRFYGNWHDWGQMLAGRGYAVLLPNPRGSTGRGTAYVNANFNDVGGGEFRDMMAGVDYLIDRGLADPERLGVGGWSWGGYMTAWTVSQTQRFKAAVMGAGLPNMISDNGLGDIPSANLSYFEHTPYHDPTLYAERSAIMHIRNATTPTLILHGASDARVNPAEGQEMYIALRTLGVPTQFVTYPREGHSISERKHQIDLMNRIIDWYGRYLNPTAVKEAHDDQ